MTTDQQKTVGIAAAIAVLTLALAYFLGIGPNLENRSANQQAESLALAKVADLNTQIADLETKQANLAKAEQEFKAIVAKFPHDYEQAAWLDMVQAAAKRTGVSVLSLDPGVPADPTAATVPGAAAAPAAPGAPAGAMPSSPIAVSHVRLTAQGNDAQTSAFIRALEGLKRPLLIGDIEMTRQGDALSAQISGTVFLTRPMSRPGEADPALPQPPPAATPDAGTTPTPAPAPGG